MRREIFDSKDYEADCEFATRKLAFEREFEANFAQVQKNAESIGYRPKSKKQVDAIKAEQKQKELDKIRAEVNAKFFGTKGREYWREKAYNSMGRVPGFVPNNTKPISLN